MSLARDVLAEVRAPRVELMAARVARGECPFTGLPHPVRPARPADKSPNRARLRRLVCKRCGRKFKGDVLAKRCKSCRKKHKKEQQRARSGLSSAPTCKRCGEPIIDRRADAVFCCKECCTAARIDLTRWQPPSGRECLWCGTSFTPRRPLSVFCKARCSKNGRYWAAKFIQIQRRLEALA